MMLLSQSMLMMTTMRLAMIDHQHSMIDHDFLKAFANDDVDDD